MTVDNQVQADVEKPHNQQWPDPGPGRWPGFCVTNLGPWSYQLRCTNCSKTTSPSSLNETLLDELVRTHRCGPALSTHWGESVSLGAGYAVALNSFAMLVELMPFGLGTEPDVQAAIARLVEAACSHRRPADELVGSGQSLYELVGRPVDEDLAARFDEQLGYDMGLDALQDPYKDTPESTGPVYVKVGDLLDGDPLPPHPVTGQAAVGVVWSPGALCIRHLAQQLVDGRLLGELGPDEGGVVIYPGDTAPACGECLPPEQADRVAVDGEEVVDDLEPGGADRFPAAITAAAGDWRAAVRDIVQASVGDIDEAGAPYAAPDRTEPIA